MQLGIGNMNIENITINGDTIKDIKIMAYNPSNYLMSIAHDLEEQLAESPQFCDSFLQNFMGLLLTTPDKVMKMNLRIHSQSGGQWRRTLCCRHVFNPDILSSVWNNKLFLRRRNSSEYIDHGKNSAGL